MAAAAVVPYMPQLNEAEIDAADGEPGHHHRDRLLNSGTLFILIAVSIIIYTVGNPSAAADPAHALLGFFLFLLGVSLALLSLVADQFPGAAGIGAAIAYILRNHLFGGL